MKPILALSLFATLCLSCKEQTSTDNELVKNDDLSQSVMPFDWDGANVYFLLTDRFNNGNTSNDVNFGRDKETGVLRGFEGGDIKGVTAKIKDGYFSDLGINAIWMTPIVEQIHGGTDEGTGLTYGFHGYWTKDWTMIDPNYGTKEDLRELVEEAHAKGIRVLLDAVINHTGPVTEEDPVWPSEWVRTEPPCAFNTYESTVTCTLVKNLPDIKTESNETVELPPQLAEKWKAEGRYQDEMAELDAFFERTGHPRAPRFYIMKWLTDYITEFGIDGYRVDTVKHTEESVWQEFRTECDYAFSEYKKANEDKVLDDNGFYLVGEVYNYGISAGEAFDFGDKKVDYFDDAFDALINFEAKWNAKQQPNEDVFSRYANTLNDPSSKVEVMNYMSSHDDGQPFDAMREKPYETATKLLLMPGASQVYYGDESARVLKIEGAVGDANLRSFMNWADIEQNDESISILEHWQKLGQFRANHPAVGAGQHQMMTSEPYAFYRSYSKGNVSDLVVVALDLSSGIKTIDVSKVFENGDVIRDAYSEETAKVSDGKLTIDSPHNMLLLEKGE